MIFIGPQNTNTSTVKMVQTPNGPIFCTYFYEQDGLVGVHVDFETRLKTTCIVKLQSEPRFRSMVQKRYGWSWDAGHDTLDRIRSGQHTFELVPLSEH